VSAIDPRLDPVLASERKSGRGVAVFGLVLLLIAATMVIAGVQREKPNTQSDVITGIMTVVFALPGLWLLRIWLRGPEATAIVRLLATNRNAIQEWDFEYVSIQGGPTQTRIKLFLRNGRYMSVDLSPGEAKGVMAYVAEAVPRRQK